jgi:polysaccharide biosynthesis/export protein
MRTSQTDRYARHTPPGRWVGLLFVLALGLPPYAQAPQGAAPGQATTPSMQIGPGDLVTVQVYGQQDLTTTNAVSDDGNLSMPLIGKVHIGGLSLDQAAREVESALKKGGILVNPYVTVTVPPGRSQQVPVTGFVKNPSRYPIDANTTVLDLLALAGGTTADAGDIVYVVRPDANGAFVRIPVNLKALSDGTATEAPIRIKSGDQLLVPKAFEFQIYGEVKNPSTFRLESGMRVFEAIAKSGGITDRGSSGRVEIKRKQPDGTFKTIRARTDEIIQPGDVIRVRESLF